MRAGIEPGAGLTTDDAVRGETVTTLELLDGLLGITIVNLITMARGAVAQLVEHGADLAKLGGALSGTQGRHIEGRPLAGHRHCQQFVHFGPHRLVFRHLRAQGFHLGEQVIIAGLGHYRAVQIELEGLHLLARDQIHPPPGVLETAQLGKNVVIDGTTLVCRGGLQALPQREKIGMQLGKHSLLQLLLQLDTGLFGLTALIPVVSGFTGRHHDLCFGRMYRASGQTSQPHQIGKGQPILHPHGYLKTVCSLCQA